MPRSQTAEEVARQRANAALAPYFAEIEAQRQAAQRRAEERARAIQGYSQAAAAMLQPIGGQVQQGYGDAAQRTASYAKGFASGQQIAVQGSADEANKLLAQNGSPQQIQSQGANSGDVLYGMGGFIPASTLEREGAAFSSAARMLPATQLGYGQQRLAQSQRDAEAEQLDFDAQRRKVESERPGILQQALADIRANNLERQKLSLADRESRAASKRDARDFKAAQARDARDFNLKVEAYAKEWGLKESEARRLLLKQGFDQRATAAKIKIQATNAQTAQKRVQAQIERDLRRAGIDDEKLALGWATLEQRAKKKGAKGFTAKQRADFRATSSAIADDAFNGIPNDPTTPEDDSAPPLDYQEALREMYQQGVPLAIAQAALNQYYKPGQRGRPKVSYQERQRRKRASRKQSQGARNAPR